MVKLLMTIIIIFISADFAIRCVGGGPLAARTGVGTKGGTTGSRGGLRR